MKVYASLFCLILTLASCKNEEKNHENKINPNTEKSVNNNISEFEPKRTNSEDTDKEGKINSPREGSKKKAGKSEMKVSGSTYVKNEISDANCNCYCLKLKENNKTELCLSEDKIYINASYKKSGSTVNFYYLSPANKNTIQELPWKDFDTNIPIAILSPDEDGNMKLDWKGFSINGELALDYAIYGKKTLEGTYKKR